MSSVNLPSKEAQAIISAQTNSPACPLFQTELWGDRLGNKELEGVSFAYCTRNALHEDIMRLNVELDDEHKLFVLSDRMYNLCDGCDVTLALVRAKTWQDALSKIGLDTRQLEFSTEQLLEKLGSWRGADDLQLLGAGADWIEFWPNNATGTKETKALLELFPGISEGYDVDAWLHEADSCGTVFFSWATPFRK